MTIDEFKAFLEGMDVQGQPTPEQWARIKEKIDALEAIRVEPFKYPDTLGMPATLRFFDNSQTAPVLPREITIGDPPPGTLPVVTC